jgi:hypothetical protein
MEMIKSLGDKAIVEYVTRNSTLKADQFTFAMEGGDGYASFLVVKENKLVRLGQLSYERFIRVEYGTTNKDRWALTKFLDLCIQKLNGKKVSVPVLFGNPEGWNKTYYE